MVEYILAIIFTASLGTHQPYIIAPYTLLEDCAAEAGKRNKSDPQTKPGNPGGAEYACLKIVRVVGAI